MDTLDEARFKRVIRKGKVKRKLFCPDGFKAKDNICRKMSPSERFKRKKANKRAARKRKVRMSQILRKRAKSIRRRAQLGAASRRIHSSTIIDRLDQYLKEG